MIWKVNLKLNYIKKNYFNFFNYNFKNYKKNNKNYKNYKNNHFVCVNKSNSLKYSLSLGISGFRFTLYKLYCF